MVTALLSPAATAQQVALNLLAFVVYHVNVCHRDAVFTDWRFLLLAAILGILHRYGSGLGLILVNQVANPFPRYGAWFGA